MNVDTVGLSFLAVLVLLGIIVYKSPQFPKIKAVLFS